MVRLHARPRGQPLPAAEYGRLVEPLGGNGERPLYRRLSHPIDGVRNGHDDALTSGRRPGDRDRRLVLRVEALDRLVERRVVFHVDVCLPRNGVVEEVEQIVWVGDRRNRAAIRENKSAAQSGSRKSSKRQIELQQLRRRQSRAPHGFVLRPIRHRGDTSMFPDRLPARSDTGPRRRRGIGSAARESGIDGHAEQHETLLPSCTDRCCEGVSARVACPRERRLDQEAEDPVGLIADSARHRSSRSDPSCRSSRSRPTRFLSGREAR